MGYILMIIASIAGINILFHVTALLVDRVRGHENHGKALLYSGLAEFCGMVVGGIATIALISLV